MSVLDKFLDAIRLNDDFDDDDEFFDDDELEAMDEEKPKRRFFKKLEDDFDDEDDEEPAPAKKIEGSEKFGCSLSAEAGPPAESQRHIFFQNHSHAGPEGFRRKYGSLCHQALFHGGYPRYRGYAY